MYQFIHIEDYSLKQNKQKNRNYSKEKALSKKSVKVKNKVQRNNTVSAVISEALRLDNYCSHIENTELSKLNNLVHGIELEKIESLCEEYAINTKDSSGRKLRSDAACLLAGVVSYERALYEENKAKYEQYKTDTVEYLKNKYKDRLKCVYEHLDEDHPHLHFYVIPHAGERIEHVHDGKKAIKDLKDLKQKREAYYKAMSDFQTDFYNKVSQKYGFTRLGPRRTRTNYKAAKQYKKDINKFINLDAEINLNNLKNKKIEEVQKIAMNQAIEDFNKKSFVAKFVNIFTKTNELKKENDKNLYNLKKLNYEKQKYKNAYKQNHEIAKKLQNQNKILKKENAEAKKINDSLVKDLVFRIKKQTKLEKIANYLKLNFKKEYDRIFEKNIKNDIEKNNVNDEKMKSNKVMKP